MDGRKLPRRERNKLRNRDEILQGAMEEFSEKGFHDTTMQDIATRAEFAIGTVYSMFDSKEDLYLELLTIYVEKAGETFLKVLEEGDDEYHQLMNYAVAKGRLFRENIKMARIALYEMNRPSSAFKSGLQPMIKEHYEFFLRRIASVFDRGIQRGIFRDFGSYYLAVLLDGITSAFLYRWIEAPEEHPYEKSLDFVREIFMLILTKEYRQKIQGR